MKNILITGASSGFGKAMADHLSGLGHHVIGTSRSPKDDPTPYHMQSLDVTSQDSVDQCVEQAIAHFGHIDILINNAGYGVGGPIEDTSIEAAKDQLETNFWGVVRMNQRVLPLMKTQGSGLIINVSSVMGLLGLPFQGFYAASKFALEGYTESLRMELDGSPISVTNICPGDFKTGFTAARNNPGSISSDYQESYKAFMKQYEDNELNGSDPKMIAELAEKIINKNGQLPVRYVVGKPIEKFAVWIKGIVGSKTFENIMLKAFDS